MEKERDEWLKELELRETRYIILIVSILIAFFIFGWFMQSKLSLCQEGWKCSVCPNECSLTTLPHLPCSPSPTTTQNLTSIQNPPQGGCDGVWVRSDCRLEDGVLIRYWNNSCFKCRKEKAEHGNDCGVVWWQRDFNSRCWRACEKWGELELKDYPFLFDNDWFKKEVNPVRDCNFVGSSLVCPLRFDLNDKHFKLSLKFSYSKYGLPMLLYDKRCLKFS